MAAIILTRLLEGHKVFCQGTLGRAALKLYATAPMAEIQARVLTRLAYAAAFTAFTPVNKNSLGHNFVMWRLYRACCFMAVG
jgi:hypothetical protein